MTATQNVNPPGSASAEVASAFHAGNVPAGTVAVSLSPHRGERRAK